MLRSLSALQHERQLVSSVLILLIRLFPSQSRSHYNPHLHPVQALAFNFIISFCLLVNQRLKDTRKHIFSGVDTIHTHFQIVRVKTGMRAFLLQVFTNQGLEYHRLCLSETDLMVTQKCIYHCIPVDYEQGLIYFIIRWLVGFFLSVNILWHFSCDLKCIYTHPLSMKMTRNPKTTTPLLNQLLIPCTVTQLFWNDSSGK